MAEYIGVGVVIFALFFNHVLAYKAAIVEEKPDISDTPKNTIPHNLNKYRDFADNARSKGADMIVFPEYGLTTVSANPEKSAVEINNSSHVIRELSSMAADRRMYLVVNLLEKERKNNETKYYNTNLVFNREGAIITKYRKINLFQEPKLTPGSKDQNNTFSTDFQVTFATFTGSDILFRNPSQTVLDNDKVTDVVFPTAWLSRMPFYTSSSIQHGYVSASGINLLAAGYDLGQDGRGGSGIYLANGKIAKSHNDSKLIQLTVTRTTRLDKTVCPSSPTVHSNKFSGNNISKHTTDKTPFRRRRTDYKTPKIFNASKYKFENVDVSLGSFSKEICHGKFCCFFTIVTDPSQSSSDIYKVMAYDGWIEYDSLKTHIRVCSLVACHNDSNDSCGERVTSTTKFSEITVNGTLERDDSTFYRPVTLNRFLLPLTETSFCDHKTGMNSSFIQLRTKKAQQDVLVFGILGRTNATVDSVATSDNEMEPDRNQTKNIPGASVQNHGVVFFVFISVIKCLSL